MFLPERACRCLVDWRLVRPVCFAALIFCPLHFIVNGLSPPAASAQATPHIRCARMHAMAESQAFLLASPTIWVEGVHLPWLSDPMRAGLVPGGAWQLLGTVSWSPLDLARGVMLLNQSGSECTALSAAARVQRTLQLGASFGELQARRAEEAVLAQALPQLHEMLEASRVRASEGLGTSEQFTALASEIVRIERRRAQLVLEVQRLAAEGDGDPSNVARDLSLYESSSMALESQRSTYRRLSPWTLQVRGGVVPTGELDWFGQVQLGFNLGGVQQQFSEDAVLEARRAELAHDGDELRQQVATFERHMEESLPALRAELEHVDRLIELTERQQELLARLETSEVAHLHAMGELQLITLRAERAHWNELLVQRTALVEDREEGSAP